MLLVQQRLALLLLLCECGATVASVSLLLFMIVSTPWTDTLSSYSRISIISAFTTLIGLTRAVIVTNWCGILKWPSTNSLRLVFTMGGYYLQVLWAIVQISLRLNGEQHLFVSVCEFIGGRRRLLM